MKPGDVIQSIYSGNKFVVEYISQDDKSIALIPKNKNEQSSRRYSAHDIRSSFRGVNQ